MWPVSFHADHGIHDGKAGGYVMTEVDQHVHEKVLLLEFCVVARLGQAGNDAKYVLYRACHVR